MTFGPFGGHNHRQSGPNGTHCKGVVLLSIVALYKTGHERSSGAKRHACEGMPRAQTDGPNWLPVDHLDS